MSDVRILVLGGTSEARALAAALQERGLNFVSSLAGRVSRPRLPVGEVHVGGFGGVEGLVRFVQSGSFTHIVDATHPFAVGMRGNAASAAATSGIPMLRLARPGWAHHENASQWHWVENYVDAGREASKRGRRPFLTSGRQTLAFFDALHDLPCLVRVVEPLPAHEVPPEWTVVLDRGPFDVPGEMALMREHGVDVLVTKDSGGEYTSAKLAAAAHLDIPVVIVKRPAAPQGVKSVETVQEVLAWLES